MEADLPKTSSVPGRMGLLYALALGALLSAGLVVTIAVPFWRTRQALSRVKVGDPGAAAEMGRLAKRLGGYSRAAVWAGLYARAPERLAPGRDNAWLLLAACGDEAEPTIRGLLAHPEARVRAVGVEALRGVVAGDAGDRPARLGVRPERAAELLLAVFLDPDARVYAAARRALAETGPAPQMPLDDYLACLADAGWSVLRRTELAPYRAVHLYNGGAGAAPGGKLHRLVLGRQGRCEHLVEREWTGTRDCYVGDPEICILAGRDDPVLAFEQGRGGLGWQGASLRLFELGGAAREITPQLPDGWCAKELRDLNRDGRKELLVAMDGADFGAGNPRAGSPAGRRVYCWDRGLGQLADASASFPGGEERKADREKRKSRKGTRLSGAVVCVRK